LADAERIANSVTSGFSQALALERHRESAGPYRPRPHRRPLTDAEHQAG